MTPLNASVSARSVSASAGGRRRKWATIGVLLGVFLISATFASRRLPDRFRALAVGRGFYDAIDLTFRWRETHAWFSGQSVYRVIPEAVYAPQTYAVLWPAIGWASLALTRWGWAWTSGAAIVLLGILFAMEAFAADQSIVKGRGEIKGDAGVGATYRGTQWLERLAAFVAITAFIGAAYPTAIALSNGQVILHVLIFLLGALLILFRGRGTWWEDCLAALLLQVPLAKLTIGLPFMWLVVLIPLARRNRAFEGLRPAIMTAGLFVALTLLAQSFCAESATQLWRQWFERARVQVGQGYGNLLVVFSDLGLKRWGMPVSVVAWALLGAWSWKIIRVKGARRPVDPWVLIGFTALFARLWTYHRTYDDLIVIPVIVALTRLLRSAPSSGMRRLAGVLLVMQVVAMLAPPRYLNQTGSFNDLVRMGEMAVWCLVFAYLIYASGRECTASDGAPG